MIKGVTNTELRKLLRDRIEKVLISEALPDPGPQFASERSSQLYELAFRRGTVRQLVELIVLAEHDWAKPREKASENDKAYYRTLCKNVVERETKMLKKSYNVGSRKIPRGVKI